MRSRAYRSSSFRPVQGERKSTLGRIRVLHVVTMMARGGVETWLVNVLRAIDRERVHLDFLVQSERPGTFDDDIRSMGAEVITCLGASRPWVFARNFRRVLAENGPYQVVHSHVHHFSGLVLGLSRWAGVPVRIAHSHSVLRKESQIARVAYYRIMRHLVRQNATHVFACSWPALRSLLGPDVSETNRCRVLSLGMDLAPFGAEVDRAAVRLALGLPADALVAIHVGRFVEEKNHHLLVEVAAEVLRRDPRAYFLLVGSGPLQREIEARGHALEFGDRFRCLGERSNVAELLISSDAFVFPSRREGLGLGLVEAQVAGLPCVASDRVPDEAVLVPQLMRRLSLSSPIHQWADAVLDALHTPPEISRSGALAQAKHSSFNITSAVEELVRIYSAAAVG